MSEIVIPEHNSPQLNSPQLNSPQLNSPQSVIPILNVQQLKTCFYTDEGVVQAVNDLDLTIHKGETIGLVGESGCGKSVTSLSIMRLIPSPPGKITGGRIQFENRDLLTLTQREMQKIRGNKISMIFQEPMTSLNPVFTVGNQIAEGMILHKKIGRAEALKRAVEILRDVQIPSPERRVRDYPHQLSGGMRQRVMIAIALSCNPRLLIADEPTTALDVTIEAQILDLLVKLKEEYKIAVLLITHDLGVVADAADTVAVMYAGKIVELGSTLEIFENTAHPYTRGLLKSVPRRSKNSVKKSRLETIEGSVPNLINLPHGCGFAPRCNARMDICTQTIPPMFTISDSHQARCFLYEE